MKIRDESRAFAGFSACMTGLFVWASTGIVAWAILGFLALVTCWVASEYHDPEE